MQYPSVKMLQRIECIDKSQALQVRDILTGKESPDEYCEKWITQCYNMPTKHDLKMHAINRIMMGYGVEYIPSGRNVKSPAIEYINLGDTYIITLLYINGSYRVGYWGDIVERGNYD